MSMEEEIEGYRKRRHLEATAGELGSPDADNQIPDDRGLTAEETSSVDRSMKRRLREGLDDRALGARNTMRRRGRRRQHGGQLR